MSVDTEKIVCAAIYFNDGILREQSCQNITTGIVVCGLRHSNCFAILSEIFPKRDYIDRCIQGFITTDNRFVDRRDAYRIALLANQCFVRDYHFLSSEDLY